MGSYNSGLEVGKRETPLPDPSPPMNASDNPENRPRRGSLPGGLTGLLCWLSLAGCSPNPAPREGPPGRGVLLISLDGLRRDQLQPWDGERLNSTFLTMLGEQSLRCDDAWATAGCVEAGHVSLLTGCDPRVARVPRIELQGGEWLDPAAPWMVTDEVPRLALELAVSGFCTAAFVDHHQSALPRELMVGFEDVIHTGDSGRTPGLVGGVECFLDWAERIGAGEDWFSYLHASDLERLWAPNTPEPRMDIPLRADLQYALPVSSTGPVFHALAPERHLGVQRTFAEHEARYAATVSDLDQALMDLWSRMEDSGLLENTTVIITGSYGLDMGEGGLLFDSGSLSQVELRVPLLVRPAPGLKIEVGREVPGLISLVDVAPTILDLCEVEIPSHMQGRSLNNLLRHNTESVRETAHAFSILYKGHAVIDSERLYVHAEPGRDSTKRLGQSFFGTSQPGNTWVEAVIPRDAVEPFQSRCDGPFGPPADSRFESLRGQGEVWSNQMSELSAALHLLAWDPEARDPDVVEGLRRLGLLP